MDMPVFGRTYAPVGLLKPTKKQGWNGYGLDAGECVRDTDGANRGIDRCFTQRGKPQGLSRFLHENLLFSFALQTPNGLAWRMHGTP